jgi:hypothetical protein
MPAVVLIGPRQGREALGDLMDRLLAAPRASAR